MDAARKLIDECQSRGIRLLARGDKLRVEAPAPLDDELRERLRASKPELLRALEGDSTVRVAPLAPGGPLHAEWRQATAILEAEGLDRDQAEIEAARELGLLQRVPVEGEA